MQPEILAMASAVTKNPFAMLDDDDDAPAAAPAKKEDVKRAPNPPPKKDAATEKAAAPKALVPAKRILAMFSFVMWKPPRS